MIEVNKNEAKFLNQTIAEWQSQQVISEEEAQKLKETLLVQNFNWAKLAKYAFIIAIICVLGAILSILADNNLLDWFFELIGTEWGAVVASALVAVGFLSWGGRRKNYAPEKVFSNEALLTLGGFFVALAVGFFGNAVSTGSNHFSILFFLAAFIYAPLSLYFRSLPIWILLLISISTGLLTELDYQFNISLIDSATNIFLIISLIWGTALVGLSLFFQKQALLSLFATATYTVGLLIAFMSLWFLSIDFGDWRNERILFELLWTIVLIAGSFAALIWGIKKEDLILKILGLGFLLFAIYTKYIQYLWDELHGAIFFAILALSFWAIGTQAENIWSGRFFKGSDDLLDDV